MNTPPRTKRPDPECPPAPERRTRVRYEPDEEVDADMLAKAMEAVDAFNELMVAFREAQETNLDESIQHIHVRAKDAADGEGWEYIAEHLEHHAERCFMTVGSLGSQCKRTQAALAAFKNACFYRRI